MEPRSLSEILSSMMANAPGNRLPPEQWPSYLRKKCLACLDLGAEYYVDPEYPDLAYVRPCSHCDAGNFNLVNWRTTDYGVWKKLSQEQVDRIMGLPCRHDPLPAPAPADVHA